MCMAAFQRYCGPVSLTKKQCCARRLPRRTQHRAPGRTCLVQRHRPVSLFLLPEVLVSPITRPKPSSIFPPAFLAVPLTRFSSMADPLLMNAADSRMERRSRWFGCFYFDGAPSGAAKVTNLSPTRFRQFLAQLRFSIERSTLGRPSVSTKVGASCHRPFRPAKATCV